MTALADLPPSVVLFIMSDGDSSDDDTTYNPIEYVDLGDPALREFCRMANDEGFRQGVTIWLAGGVISGDLVGMREWSEALQEQMSAVEPDATLGFLESWLPEVPIEGAKVATEPSEHVHLIAAKASIGPGAFLHLPAWRGRTASVSGWSFGTHSLG